MRRTVPVLCAAAAVLLLTSCGGNDDDTAAPSSTPCPTAALPTALPDVPLAAVQVDESANGTALPLFTGQRLVVQLPQTSATGQPWSVGTLDQNALLPSGDPDTANGTTTWAFRAANAGPTQLQFVSVQPGQQPDAASIRWTLQVRVLGG